MMQRVVEAARRGDVHELAALVSSLPPAQELPCEGRSRQTCLHHAAHHGQLEVLQLLLAANFSIDPVDARGNTPLMLACAVGDEKAAACLIEASASVNQRNSRGQTSLITTAGSAAAAHAAVLQLLLASHAAVDERDSSGATALTCAAQRGRAEIVQLLLEAGADPSGKSHC